MSALLTVSPLNSFGIENNDEMKSASWIVSPKCPQSWC